MRHFEIFWVRKLEVKATIDIGQCYLGDLFYEGFTETNAHTA